MRRPELLLERGLLPVDRSLESHWVRPGAATAVRVHPGDRDGDHRAAGGRIAEVTVLGAEGGERRRSGCAPTRPRRVLRGLAQQPGALASSARCTARGWSPTRRAPCGCSGGRAAGRGGGPDGASARRCSSWPRRAAGSSTARWPAWRAAAGGRRAEPAARRGGIEHELPPPLAEPRLDFRVDGATARGLRGPRRRVHPDHRRRGAQCSDFLAFRPRASSSGARARPRRDDDAHADGRRYPSRGSTTSSSTWTWARWWRSCGTPSAATTPSRWPAPPSTTRTSAIRATSTARRTSTASSRPIASRRARAGRRSTSSTTRASTRATSFIAGRAVVAARATTCCCARRRPGLRLVGLSGRHRPRQRLGDHRRPRPRLRPREPLLDGDRPPRHPGG